MVTTTAKSKKQNICYYPSRLSLSRYIKQKIKPTLKIKTNTDRHLTNKPHLQSKLITLQNQKQLQFINMPTGKHICNK